MFDFRIKQLVYFELFCMRLAPAQANAKANFVTFLYALSFLVYGGSRLWDRPTGTPKS